MASQITAVANVAVPVTDHDRALEFYVGTLGFEKRIDAEFGGGQRWVEVAPAGATTTIALAPPGEVAAGRDTGIRLTTEVCLDGSRNRISRATSEEDP